MTGCSGSGTVTVRPAKLPSSLKVTICHVDSPSLFFVYANDNLSEDLETQLNIFMEQYGALMRLTEPPTPGTFVVCRFSKDDRYYRAVVRAWPESEQHRPGQLLGVHYLDYGNSETVRWKEGRLFRLWPHFADMAPVLAIPCAHYGIQPIAIGGWTDTERQLFRARLSEFSNGFQAQLVCRFHWPPARTRRGLQRAVAYAQLFRMTESGEAGKESSLASVSGIGKGWIRASDCCYPLEMNIKNTLPAGFPDLELVDDEGSPYSGQKENSALPQGGGEAKVEVKEEEEVVRAEAASDSAAQGGKGIKLEVRKTTSEEKRKEIAGRRQVEEAWQREEEEEEEEEKEKEEAERKEAERRKNELRKEEERRKEEEKSREERRKDEEIKKKVEEAKRKIEELIKEEDKRREKREAQRKEEEKRKEEERRREEAKKKEEIRRKEEHRRAEVKKLEEERKKEEERKEAKRIEEERKREEERKKEEARKLEEERKKEKQKREAKRIEEERRKEEERKKKEAERIEEKRRKEEDEKRREREEAERKAETRGKETDRLDRDNSREERREKDSGSCEDRGKNGDRVHKKSGDSSRDHWDDRLYQDGRSSVLRHCDGEDRRRRKDHNSRKNEQWDRDEKSQDHSWEEVGHRDRKVSDHNAHWSKEEKEGHWRKWRNAMGREDYRRKITSAPDAVKVRQNGKKADSKEERKAEGRKAEAGEVKDEAPAALSDLALAVKVEPDDVPKARRSEKGAEEEEEEEECRSPSPITTLACSPPDIKSEFPFGRVTFGPPFEGLPELVLPLRDDGGLSALAFHVVSPSDFELCLVTTETSAMMQWLEKAMSNHYSWVLSGQLVYMFDGFSPEVGTLVCAHYKETFVRAVVLKTNYEYTRTKSVLVRFIDYGDQVWVGLKTVYPLSPSMLAVPALSLSCSLYGLAPMDAEWSEAAKSLFRAALGPGMPNEQASAQMLLAHLIDVHPGKTLSTKQRVRVMLRTTENVLVNVKLAEIKEPKVAHLTQEFIKVLDELSEGSVKEEKMGSEDLSDEGWNISHDVYRQSLAKVKDPTKRHSTATRVCEFFRVRGRCVWGQNCRNLHVRDTDEAAVNLNFERNVNSTVDVAFVDSGNHMDYPAEGALIGLRVTTWYSPVRFYAQLLHGPDDYCDRPDKLPSLCDSSSRSFADWTALTEAMNLHYSEETPRDLKDELYAAGEVVAVRSATDKQWYRARVLDHDSSLTEVSVFFLDTGDVEEVHQMWVHPLLFLFLEGLPIQAFECTLQGLGPPHGGWSQEAMSTVRLHTDGRPLHARVEDINPSGILQVTVWDCFTDSQPTSPSLNDLLVKNGLAVLSGGNMESAWTCSDDPNFVIFPA